jgi:aspartokinase/homoserine dehydrogenase 1
MKQFSALNKTYPEPVPESSTCDLFVAGIGAVGGTLIRQIRSLSDSDLFHIVGVCNSTRTLWIDEDEQDINVQALAKGEVKNWNQILNRLEPAAGKELIFIDTTGTLEATELYIELFEKGIHVVTPSKLANTKTQDHFDLLRNTADENGVKFLYETNVGAGLPVIRTVQDLVKSGDEIVEISGVLSGTMTYIFSQLDAGQSFSETVLKARQLGYAEPDPRDDLSGEDVARKMMILSRVSGYSVERKDLAVEPITPKELTDVDSSVFLRRLKEYDSEWTLRLRNLKKQGKTLRYLGK